MSCLSEGNKRCTKCCEALHINKSQYISFINKKINIEQGDTTFGKGGLWEPISKRRAKKINPYIFDRSKTQDYSEGGWRETVKRVSKMQFFRCRALVEGVGCSVRELDIHPHTCKVYTGGYEYSPTCYDDINIIARSS